MGGINPGGPDRVLQEFTANPNGLIYSSPVYFDGKIYIQGVGDVLKAFALKLDRATNTMMIQETPVSQGARRPPASPGRCRASGPAARKTGSSGTRRWTSSRAPRRSSALYAANDLSKVLYSSDQAGSPDTAGGAVRFVTPTVANGMVYLGAEFEVDAYGLLRRQRSPSRSVGTTAGTVPNHERGDLAAATPTRRATTGISRAAGTRVAVPIAAARAKVAMTAQLAPLSGDGLASLHDLVLSQSDGDIGFVSFANLKKTRSAHHS